MSQGGGLGGPHGCSVSVGLIDMMDVNDSRNSRSCKHFPADTGTLCWDLDDIAQLGYLGRLTGQRGSVGLGLQILRRLNLGYGKCASVEMRI